MNRYPKAERARGYLIAKDLDDEPVDDEVRALPVEIVVDAPRPPEPEPGRLFD